MTAQCGTCAPVHLLPHLPFPMPLLLILLLLLTSPALASHGVSIDGKLKYPADFQRFAYTSPAAKVGGALTLHALGSFDKFNPFTLKGAPPDGVSELVFETLTVASLDEPFARYGLLAQDLELAKDGLSLTITLNPAAKFSDNSPVTTADVKFSLETLKSDAAHPFYATYFQDVLRAEIISEGVIRFHFGQANREIHIIACELPVFSRTYYENHPFKERGLTPPLGSGPYQVAHFKPGKTITYRRNPDYWGWHLPVRRGMFNFETITFKFFKDQIVSLEAFKAGDFDFMPINIAKQWARDMKGDSFSTGRIVKEHLKHSRNAGMQGFVMNSRRPLFSDAKVRRALGLAFDFSWTNKSLFFGQYTQCDSYFSNSAYAATGLPSSGELELLEPWRGQLPEELFTTPPRPVTTTEPGQLRENLRLAQKLLKEAGWQYRHGALRNKAGEPFKFEIMLATPSFERVMAPYVQNLARLGIEASYRTIDMALYIRNMRTFDYDMMVNVFGQSQSPGNEQRLMWSAKAADQPGSRNYAGIKDPVVDFLVAEIIAARDQEELVTAVRALDRVLLYGFYVVPNWYAESWRLVYWNKFGQPAELPLYYTPFEVLMTWWLK
ncbi:MAG: extracellular solute-binding protein [Thermodesulfobacteriota bacterium]